MIQRLLENMAERFVEIVEDVFITVISGNQDYVFLKNIHLFLV